MAAPPRGHVRAFFALECSVYKFICDDWLHSLHANVGNAAAKDVEITPLWWLPFRYVHLLLNGNRLAPLYSVCACVGLWAGWTKYGTCGRVLVVWFGALYLEFSCIVQSFHPILPLIGSTARYLASVALPVALLTALGVRELWDLLRRKFPRFATPLLRRPIAASFAVFALLAFFSSRPFFDLGFTTDLRRYMAMLPDGTRIFSHHFMRDVACLADASAARRFVWTAPRTVLSRRPELEQAAAASDEFCCLRKQVWVTERKRVEHNGSLVQPPLGTYLETPERDWKVSEVLAKGDATDIVLSSRRHPGDPPPHLLNAASPELTGLFPGLPVEWNNRPKLAWIKWNIPAVMRGKILSIQFEGSSADVEPLNARFDFIAKKRHEAEVVFKPIFYRAGGKDFFALKIPSNAERCDIQLKFNKSASVVRLTDFRASYDDTP